MFVINWLPPFTLEGISVSYLIQIKCVAVSWEETTVVRNETKTETFAIAHADNNSCMEYITCVMAVTEAGEGQPGCVNLPRILGK